MKANQLAILMLRLLGIYTLADAIPSIPALFISINKFWRVGDDSIEIGYGILYALQITIGVLLLVFATPLGRKLAPQGSTEEHTSAITFKQASTLAFAVAGVLIFASALPQLISSIFNLLRETSADDSPLNPNWITSRRAIAESSAGILLKTAFGIWLFFGAEGFANFFGLLRNFGTPKPPPAE